MDDLKSKYHIPTTPLQYLMGELKFASKDWIGLNETDRTSLKQMAKQEMVAVGIEVAEGK